MNKMEILVEIQDRLLTEMDRLNLKMLDLSVATFEERDFYTKEAVLTGKIHGLALAFDIVTEMIKKQKI